MKKRRPLFKTLQSSVSCNLRGLQSGELRQHPLPSGPRVPFSSNFGSTNGLSSEILRGMPCHPAYNFLPHYIHEIPFAQSFTRLNSVSLYLVPLLGNQERFQTQCVSTAFSLLGNHVIHTRHDDRTRTQKNGRNNQFLYFRSFCLKNTPGEEAYLLLISLQKVCDENRSLVRTLLQKTSCTSGNR